MRNSLKKSFFEDIYLKEDPWFTKRGVHEQYRIRKTFEEIKKFGSFEKTLDIGCGEGAFTKYLSRISKQVLATDISERAIDRAKEYLAENNVIFLAEDAKDLKFIDKFNLIVALEVLYYLDDADQLELLENVKNVLAEKGIFALSVVVNNKKYYNYGTIIDMVGKNFRIIKIVTISSKIPFSFLPSGIIRKIGYELIIMPLTKFFPKFLANQILVIAE